MLSPPVTWPKRRKARILAEARKFETCKSLVGKTSASVSTRTQIAHRQTIEYVRVTKPTQHEIIGGPVARCSHHTQGRPVVMTIDYDAGTMTGWCGLPCLLFRFRGTVCAGAIMGPMFWISNLGHIAVLIIFGKIPLNMVTSEVIYDNVTNATMMVETELWTPYEVVPLDWRAAVVSLSLLFFFIVFMAIPYQRFYQLYGHCVGIGGTTMEWVSLVKWYSEGIPEPIRSTARWNAVRYVLGATHVLYYSLFGTGLEEDEWKIMAKRSLLSQEEIGVLKAYKGMKPFLPCNWALLEVEGILVQSARQSAAAGTVLDATRHEVILSQFREVMFKFRGHCGQIVNWLKQPVPFPYFHLLNVILLSQLVLLAYGLGTMSNIAYYFSIQIMVFVTIVLLGMRGLAVQLSNPFGTDAVDFELEAFMKGAYENAKAHLRQESRAPLVGRTADKILNPIAPAAPASVEDALVKAWEARPENIGKIADDDRAFTSEFTDGLSGAIDGASKWLGGMSGLARGRWLRRLHRHGELKIAPQIVTNPVSSGGTVTQAARQPAAFIARPLPGPASSAVRHVAADRTCRTQYTP